MLIADEKDLEEQRRRSAERGRNDLLQGPAAVDPAEGKWVGPGSAEWEAKTKPEQNQTPFAILGGKIHMDNVMSAVPYTAKALRFLADEARLTAIEREMLLRAAAILEVIRT